MPLKAKDEGGGMKDERHALKSFSFILHPSRFLLGFFVPGMFTAAAAEFLEFKPLRRRLFIFRRRIITTLTIRALQHYIIACHNLPFKPRTALSSKANGIALIKAAIQRYRRPYRLPPFSHPREWRTSTPSPSLSALLE
jgi:hypothetical protein